MLGAMKNIKMLGMQQTVADHVESLRREELNAAKGVRWLMVAYNASGELPSSCSPAKFAGLTIKL